MVLPFIPLGNDTNRCAGVAAFEAGRSPMSESLHAANIAVFAFHQCFAVITLAMLWRQRNKPRFAKVRPFGLSAALVVCLLTGYLAPATLFPVLQDQIPCALVMFFYVIPVAGFGAVLTMRAVLITTETLYSGLAKKEQHIFALDASETASQTTAGTHVSSSISVSSVMSSLAVMWKLILLTLGCIKPSDLTITEIVFLKNSYYNLFAQTLMPGIIITILLVTIFPEYRECNCELFSEIALLHLVFVGLYSGTALRAMAIAYSVGGMDQKGVLEELFAVPVVIGPLITFVWILMVVDPGDLWYTRQFNWSIIFGATALVMWYICFGYQLLIQHRADRESFLVGRLETMQNMSTTISNDPDIKRDFTEFASKQFVTESLQFLEDIHTYRTLYYEKAETWRMSKFKNLVESYILPGSRLEINISYAQRKKIIDTYEQAKKLSKFASSEDGFKVFDGSYDDVNQMITNGVWMEFLVQRNRKNRRASRAVLPLLSTRAISAYLRPPGFNNATVSDQ